MTDPTKSDKDNRDEADDVAVVTEATDARADVEPEAQLSW